MLTLLYGTRGARESIYEKIRSDVEGGKRAYLIVPDQKALLAEEALMKYIPRTAALLVDAVGFSRLANLVCRRYGSLTYRYATNGAKAVIMYSAIKKLRPALNVFGGDLQSGVLEALCSLCREFRTCSVSPDDLQKASDSLGDGPLKDKTGDLALIYAEYEDLLHKNFSEVEDDLDTLASLLEENDFFEGANVYIDSFVSFTKQEMTIIGRMLAKNVNVTMALPFSRVGAHMEECRDTRKKLLSLASKLSAKVYEEYASDLSPDALKFAKENMWNFAFSESFDGDTKGVLKIVECYDKNEEAENCLKEIYSVLCNGGSFSDIAIIARNSQSYVGTVDRLLKKCKIPFFFSKKTDASLLPLTGLILSALSLYIGDFNLSDMTAYIKCGLCGISDDECDVFEEYIDRWNINGRARYLDGEDFTMSKEGYTAKAVAPETLADVNEIKRKLTLPLTRFCDSLDGAKTVTDFATAVYEYLDELGIKESCQNPSLVRYFGTDRTEDAIRLWNITLDALDTLVEASSDEEITAAEFLVLIKILFSAIDIASIPSSKDQIIIGDAGTIRIDGRDTVIVLGAVEGVFPAAVNESPTLCESEREVLEKCGISLSQNLMLRSSRELYHFVHALDFAKKRAVISYYTNTADGSPAKPSFAINRLRKMFSSLEDYSFSSLAPIDKIFFSPAAAEATGTFDAKTELALKNILTKTGEYAPPLESDEALTNCMSALDTTVAKLIYGNHMSLSQSKIDSYSECNFRHFLSYILKLEDTAPHEFNPANIGTYVHSILENFVKDAIDTGKDIGKMTDEEIDEYAKAFSVKETEKVIASSGKKNARVLCFFERIYRNIRLILKNLREEFKNSSFKPLACEYRIGLREHTPLEISLGEDASVSLNGIADRIDICKKDGKTYLRVVDYKTGKKPFSESDLENGKNLQLLIYLFTLCRIADSKFASLADVEDTRDLSPAAAVYFVVKTPEIKLDAPLSEGGEELAKDRLERKGFIFSSEELGDMMDKSADKLFTEKLISKDEDGEKSLYETVCKSIAKVANDMRSGKIDTEKTSTGTMSPCRYCEFVHVCRRQITITEEEEDA